MSTVGTRVAGSCCRHCDRQVMRATCAWRAGWARATIGARVARGTTCEGRSRPFGSGEVWHRRRAGDGAGQRTSLEESEPPKCLGRHVCTGLRCLPPKHATRHPPHHIRPRLNMRAHMRRTEEHRGAPRRSEVHRAAPRRTELHRGPPRPTEAHRGAPRRNEAQRGAARRNEAQRGAPRRTAAGASI